MKDIGRSKEEGEVLKKLTKEVLAAFEKFEKVTGKSVEGFHWDYAPKGTPFHRRRIIFELKKLEWPFDTNARPPDKKPDFGGILV